jgi:Zinc dependent phospholipase C.
MKVPLRIGSVLVTVTLLVTALATPALAWSNGPEGCNSYGTHDWILGKAINAAGNKASWVKVGVALRATDDPDCKDGIDHASGTWWHVYDRWGSEWGGADEAAAVWFKRTKKRLANGKNKAASRALGYLAHFVGDVAQPMHTDSSDKEDGVHSSFESAVDSRTGDYGFRYDGRDMAKAGATIRKLARQAHKKYWALVNAYDAHGYNSKVHRITTRQLKRAANAMADLITSLKP